MSSGKFDEFIKDQLGNTSPDVPSRIWDNIVAAREERKPKAFWWNIAEIRNVAAGLAILAGCFSITWLIGHRNHDKNELTISTPAVKNNTNTNTPFNNNKSTINNNNTDRSTAQDQTVSTATVLSANAVAPQPSSDNNNNAVVNRNNVSSYVIVDKHSGRKTIVINRRAGFAKSRVHQSNQDQSAGDDQTTTASTDLSNNQAINTTTATDNTTTEASTDKAASLTASIKKDAVVKKKAITLGLPECPTVEKPPSRKRDYVEFYVSPDYGIRSMSDAANPAYLKSRDSSSGFRSAYSVGVSYTKVFANGLSLREGLNYSQINEWFTAAKNNSDTLFLINQAHDTLGKTVTFKITHNHYSSIDIPITVGYEFPIGNSSRFVANINAGAIINVLSWQNGDVLDTSNNTIHITTNKSPYTMYSFKTAMGLGLVADIALYYKLNDQVSVFAEPFARYNIQPMTQDVAPFTERYTTIGLHLGVRFDMR